MVIPSVNNLQLITLHVLYSTTQHNKLCAHMCGTLLENNATECADGTYVYAYMYMYMHMYLHTQNVIFPKCKRKDEQMYK